jgi:hypothetical protein
MTKPCIYKQTKLLAKREGIQNKTQNFYPSYEQKDIQTFELF